MCAASIRPRNRQRTKKKTNKASLSLSSSLAFFSLSFSISLSHTHKHRLLCSIPPTHSLLRWFVSSERWDSSATLELSNLMKKDKSDHFVIVTSHWLNRSTSLADIYFKLLCVNAGFDGNPLTTLTEHDPYHECNCPVFGPRMSTWFSGMRRFKTQDWIVTHKKLKYKKKPSIWVKWP